MAQFSGAKLILLIGGQVVTLLRDDDARIPFPDMWDFPGGGREGDETPETCVLRETFEELNLRLCATDLRWKRAFTSPVVPGSLSYWFAASLPQDRARDIVLGDEGQCWSLMAPDQWLADDRAIAHFKRRLSNALDALARHDIEKATE